MFTSRLRLEPVGPHHAADLWKVHNDPAVSRWYDDWKPTLAEAEQRAKDWGDSWRIHGVHKWMAYERITGALVGRGGLSRVPIDEDWGRIHAFLPLEPWVAEPYESDRPFVAHANWLEIGWALRRPLWGQGYASEIGRAGLAFAFERLRAQAVVSCADSRNARSRAVMDRIGMRHAGEIPQLAWVDGRAEEQDDVPYAVSVILRGDWRRSASP